MVVCLVGEVFGGWMGWGGRTKVEIVAIFAVFGCGVGCSRDLLGWCDEGMYCAIIELAMSKW